MYVIKNITRITLKIIIQIVKLTTDMTKNEADCRNCKAGCYSSG